MATDISYPPTTMSLPINSINFSNNTHNTHNTCNNYYTIDDFYEVKNNIRDKLGDIMYFSQETRELFDKMILSVPQIVRKKKYQTEEEWRKKKISQFKKETNDQNEKNYHELKGYLNKISANNYLSILEEINKLLAMFQNKEHYLFTILNDILKKARAEPTYCVYYVKIIIGLNDKENVKKFINELKNSFNHTIINLIIKNVETNDENTSTVDDDNGDDNVDDNVDDNGGDNMDDDNEKKDNENLEVTAEDKKEDDEESYDDFCLSRKNKNFLKGLSQFIAELFNYHQLTIDELISYWEILVNNIITSITQINKNGEYMFDNIKKSLHMNIEENVLYLCPLVEKAYENLFKNQLQSHQMEKIQTIFKKIEDVSIDKTVVNKNRYLLIDLLDLYRNCNNSVKKPKEIFKNIKSNKNPNSNSNPNGSNDYHKHQKPVNNGYGYRGNNSRYHGKDKERDNKFKVKKETETIK